MTRCADWHPQRGYCVLEANHPGEDHAYPSALDQRLHDRAVGLDIAIEAAKQDIITAKTSGAYSAAFEYAETMVDLMNQRAVLREVSVD